jgi:hypothetical protein
VAGNHCRSVGCDAARLALARHSSVKLTGLRNSRNG